MMSRNYSLCSIHKRGNSRDILRHLAPLLAPVSRSRLANLDWLPAHEDRRTLRIGVPGVDAWGIANLDLDTDHFENENLFSVSLAVPLEPKLRKTLKPGEAIEANGITHIGPLWLSIQAGEKYVLLALTAASDEISHVLHKSEIVKGMWRDFTVRSGAILSYLRPFNADTGQEEYAIALVISPAGRGTHFPEMKTLTFRDSPRYSVDHYVNFGLAKAKPWSQ